MSEQFSIMIGNRSRFDAGDPGGYWLDMPRHKGAVAARSYAERRHYRRQPAGFFHSRLFRRTRRNILPCLMKWYAPPTWTNSIFLRRGSNSLTPAEVGKLKRALQQKNGLANIGQVIDFTYNVDFYVHIPEVITTTIWATIT